MWLKRNKYVPVLPDFLALCERNYAQLNRYLAADPQPGQTSDISINPQHCYRVTVTEVAPFTTTLRIELLPPNHALFRPGFVVRLYHDAQLAEVLSCQQIKGFKARYDYPNTDMLLPDEKLQINLLLRDWLKLCACQGYNNKELAFS